MKRILQGLFVLSLLMFEGCTTSFLGSWSVGYQKGVTAYKRGDYETAWREWTPLAREGNVDAQLNLGMMHAKGKGVPQNYKIAVKWLTLAAEQGDADAQYHLERLLAAQKQIDKSSQSSTFEKAKKQCSSIGFKEGTEKFGDCVMILIN